MNFFDCFFKYHIYRLKTPFKSFVIRKKNAFLIFILNQVLLIMNSKTVKMRNGFDKTIQHSDQTTTQKKKIFLVIGTD